MQRFKVTVGATAYEVLVEPLEDGSAQGGALRAAHDSPASAHSTHAPIVPPASQKPVPSASAATPSLEGATAVKSPLAGRVVAIDAPRGENVHEGDRLLTVEAMKMNTYVYAPCSGSITQVLVAVGDGVEQGQILAYIKE